MRSMLRCLLAFGMLIVVAPPAQMAAQAPPAPPVDTHKVMQVYQCELGEGVTEVMLETAMQDWLKALKTLPGGEKIDIKILWPVAVNNMGKKDFQAVLTWPSFSTWGTSQDAYTDDSAAAKWEALQLEKWSCPDSAIWEGVTIEPSK
jgi:hypothetical protein